MIIELWDEEKNTHMPNLGEWATSTSEKMKIKFREKIYFKRGQFCTNKLLKQACSFLASLDASQFCNLQSWRKQCLLEQIFLHLTILNFKTICFSNKTTKLHQILHYCNNTHSNTLQKYAKCQYILPASATEPLHEFEFWTLTQYL